MQPNTSPRVSVVLTCYNYARYLPEAVESVLSQTVDDFELIIVNDGSTDRTAEVAGRFLTDARVRYIYQENGGQAKAKNRGIREARGAFIAFLDADDVWSGDKLERQLPLFRDARV